MKFNPAIHHRHSQRLRGYDYFLAGAYFVTICTQGHESLFGEVVGSEWAGSRPAHFSNASSETPRMVLNAFGRVVEATWYDLVNHHAGIELGAFICMPNHVHGIVVIKKLNPVGAGLEPAHIKPTKPVSFIPPAKFIRTTEEEGYKKRTGCGVPEPAPTKATLSEIVRQFKTFSSKRINALRETPGSSVWQRNYYDHIIRDEEDLARINEYIEANPARWAQMPDDW
jgi:putative transposase